MLKVTFLLWLAMACAGIGNIFFGKGMQKVGPLQNYRLAPLARYFLKAIANPHIILGVIISTAYFFLWLLVLSLADVSWALPMNAIEYVFVTLLAILILKEKVDSNRWIGVGLISIGILFMMKSW